MKAEKFEFLKMSVEERRRKAEKVERAELEKAGRLADILKTSIEKEEALSANAKPSGEEQARERRALLEQAFKEKTKKDRISERENSRGR